VTVELNRPAYEHARNLIERGLFVFDDRDLWSEHQPSTAAEDRYLEENGFRLYGLWFLGVDRDEADETKAHYSFPYGDFEKVHRCGVLSAEVRAGQYKHLDIEAAAAHLHGMIEATNK
jgi:hypothetical protein